MTRSIQTGGLFFGSVSLLPGATSLRRSVLQFIFVQQNQQSSKKGQTLGANKPVLLNKTVQN